MKRMFFGAVVFFAMISVVSGCTWLTGDDETPNPNLYKMQWGGCPDYIDNSEDCALVEVPLDYGDENGESIEIFVYRRHGTASKIKGQIWFLQGGPGASGAVFAPYFDQSLLVRYPQYDYYSLDHRGVGNSTKLDCPSVDWIPDDVSGCVNELEQAWGDGVKSFTVTNAAMDLGKIIEAAREPGQPVMVYAASYGTYWAQRYLQLFPDQADAVVLDSISNPGISYFDDTDLDYISVGKSFMEVCGKDAVCKSRLSYLGATPNDAVAALFNKLDSGELCSEFTDDYSRRRLRRLFGAMLMNDAMRRLIPPLIVRIDRCETGDLEALANLQEARDSMVIEAREYLQEKDLFSYALYWEIVFSEQWLGRSLLEIEQITDGAYFSIDGVRSSAEMYATGLWPVYSNDGYFDEYANTKIPMLMLAGGLDPQTPLHSAKPAAQAYNHPHQTFVTLPYSPHIGIINSPTYKSIVHEGAPCGEQMVFSFYADPDAPVNQSCMSELYPLEFSGSSALNRTISKKYFGTDDMWDGDPQKSATATLSVDNPMVQWINAAELSQIHDPHFLLYAVGE